MKTSGKIIKIWSIQMAKDKNTTGEQTDAIRKVINISEGIILQYNRKGKKASRSTIFTHVKELGTDDTDLGLFFF